MTDIESARKARDERIRQGYLETAWREYDTKTNEILEQYQNGDMKYVDYLARKELLFKRYQERERELNDG